MDTSERSSVTKQELDGFAADDSFLSTDDVSADDCTTDDDTGMSVTPVSLLALVSKQKYSSFIFL